MAAYIARRSLWLVLVLFVVSVITFALMRAVPGGPFDREKELPPAVIANLEAKYHLDQPIHIQYLSYMSDILVPRITDGTFQRSAIEDYLIVIPLPNDNAIRIMNFGPSLRQRSRTVTNMIQELLPVSFQLGMAAMGVALLIGIPAGVVAALNRNTVWDYLGMGIATLGVSVTVITLGPILQYVFGVNLKILPVSGWFTNMSATSQWQWWQFTLLPAFSLGFAEAAIIARLTRASLLQVMNEDYIRTARAKGLPERRVIILHALKNAMIPVMTVVGPLTAFLVTGSFVTERIFAIPGLGEKFVSSISDRDYPLIMGTTLLFAFILVIANTLVDISYAWLDPRIRYN